MILVADWLRWAFAVRIFWMEFSVAVAWCGRRMSSQALLTASCMFMVVDMRTGGRVIRVRRFDAHRPKIADR